MVTPTQEVTFVAIAFAALTRSVEWLCKAIISNNKRPKNENGDHVTGVRLGDLTPEDWEGRISKIRDEGNEDLMADMRSLLEARMATFSQPIVNEIQNLRHDMAKWEIERSRHRHTDHD